MSRDELRKKLDRELADLIERRVPAQQPVIHARPRAPDCAGRRLIPADP